MKNNQNGFSALVVIILVVVIAAVGLVTYQVVNNKNSNPVNNQTNTNQNDQNNNSNTPIAANYLEIPEWGIRIAFEDADKVTYKIQNYDNQSPVAELLLKESAMPIEECRPLGTGFTRDTVNNPDRNTTKVGDYYYWLGGGPGACEDPGNSSEETGPNDALRIKINDQLTKSTITAIP